MLGTVVIDIQVVLQAIGKNHGGMRAMMTIMATECQHDGAWCGIVCMAK